MQQPILVHLGNTLVPARILVQMGPITGPGILVTFTPGEPGVLINTDGVGPGVYVEFDDTAPATPTALAAFGGVGGAYVQWATTPFATSYDVESSPDNSTWTTISSAQPGTSYSDSTGNVYYRVRATNAHGSSAYTAGVAAGSPLTNSLIWLRSVHGFTSSTWSTQDGTGNNATQATSGNQMSLVTNVLGGKSVVRCVDANRLMDLTNILPTSATFCQVALFKTSDLTQQNIFFSGNNGAGTHVMGLFTGQVPSSLIVGSPPAPFFQNVLSSHIGVGNPQTEWCLAVLNVNQNLNKNFSSGALYGHSWWINGQCGGIQPSGQALVVTAPQVSIGGIQGQPGFGYVGDFAELMIGSSYPTAAEMNALANMLNATYGLSIRNFAKQVLFVGDSLTNCAAATPAGGSWASLVAANDTEQYYINQGESGAFCTDAIALAPTGLYPYTSCGVPTTCTVLFGANDLFVGVTGGQLWANIVTLCQGLRANGATRIVLSGVLPRTGNETQRQAFRTLALANWPSIADAYFDVDTTPIGVAGANTSRTYYAPDDLHLNDTGCAVYFYGIAPLINPSVVLPPVGPIDLIITQSSGNLALSWTASAGATGYDVQSASFQGGPYATISSNQAGTTFTDTGAASTAAAGTTGEAYYRVRAQVSGTPSLWTINGGLSVYPVFDTFVDPNGTLLTAHTMPAGAGWNLGEHDQPAVIEGNNATFVNSSLFSNNIAWTDTGLADATVSLTGFLSNVGGHAYNLFLVFRYVDDNNYWYVNYAGSGNGVPGLVLNEISGGVTTQRDLCGKLARRRRVSHAQGRIRWGID